MIEKKIEEAQEEIYEDRFLFNGENIHFDNDDEEEMYYSGQIKEAIKLGANWALEQFLNDLWHPASEEPDVRNKTIICLYDDGSICQDYEVYVIATDHDTHNLQIGEFNWNCYAENEGIKKWCYKDELIPKKGGKQ